LTGGGDRTTIKGMGTTLRSLVLIAAGLLLLPQGWCCFVLCVAPAPPKPPVPSPPSCCESSCPVPADEAPSEPTQPLLCCCDDLSSDRPPQQVVVTADLTVSDPPSDPPSAEQRPAAPNAPFVASSPPAHILQCVWLC
jgi:hypothetical protein